MRTIENYLKESLLRHIAIELKNEDIIYEKYGEYDGCSELSEFIYNKLQKNNFNNIEIEYKEVENIENIVFDKLYIIFKESKDNIINYLIPSKHDKQILRNNGLNDNYEEYSVINKDTNRFKYCLIVLSTTSFRNTKIKSILNHELNHMYVDYKLQLQGLKSFFELFNNLSYKRTREYNQHKHPLKASQLENALYLMNEYEKNAFISQLCSEIRELKTSDEYYRNGKLNANKIYNMIQQLDIYKAYMNIGNFINDYDNDALTRNEKEIIIDEWKNIYNEDLTLEQIFKKLKQKFIRTKQKIESIIPKKIVEEYRDIKDMFGIDSDVDISNPFVI